MKTAASDITGLLYRILVVPIDRISKIPLCNTFIYVFGRISHSIGWVGKFNPNITQVVAGGCNGVSVNQNVDLVIVTINVGKVPVNNIPRPNLPVNKF